MDSLTAGNVSWHPAKKILFRFCLVYFFLYCFPFPVDAYEFTKPVVQPLYDLLDRAIPYIAGKWFNLHATPAFPMFDKMDDSNYGLTFLYLNIIISSIAAIIWSMLDRKRKNYEKLYQWLRLYLRYYLAAYLFGYGFVKVFPSQFQPITASRLALSVGEQSPMLLAWNFMGYSAVMMRLNGIAEVIAGLLLLFRRTATTGAILSCCIFSFIVMMDFCFNVPIRLFSSHLLVISVFITLEDRQKLANVFFLNKATNATAYAPLLNRASWQKTFSVLLALMGISLIYSAISNAVKAEKEYGWSSIVAPLYGIYNTSYFIKNRDTILPLETDSIRWKQLVIDGGSWKQSGIITLGTGKKAFYNMQTDTVKRFIKMQSQVDTSEKYTLYYFIQNDNDLLLKGQWKRDSIEILMRRYDLNNYLLHSEKFTWITE